MWRVGVWYVSDMDTVNALMCPCFLGGGLVILDFHCCISFVERSSCLSKVVYLYRSYQSRIVLSKKRNTQPYVLFSSEYRPIPGVLVCIGKVPEFIRYTNRVDILVNIEAQQILEGSFHLKVMVSSLSCLNCLKTCDVRLNVMLFVILLIPKKYICFTLYIAINLK